uniref:General transcription factor IIH subunit 3 n=1 Tax=Sexangularia sp. CB-2014 TaxID=1486929 RepID=A0A7S1V729_9EUKA
MAPPPYIDLSHFRTSLALYVAALIQQGKTVRILCSRGAWQWPDGADLHAGGTSTDAIVSRWISAALEDDVGQSDVERRSVSGSMVVRLLLRAVHMLAVERDEGAARATVDSAGEAAPDQEENDEREDEGGQILIFRGLDDAALPYRSFMNGAFAAQSMGVLIDTVLFSPAGESSSPSGAAERNSTLFGQAASLTGGTLSLLPASDSCPLLATLFDKALPDAACRKRLASHSLANALSDSAPASASLTLSLSDHRGACVCHSTLVSTAWLCSSCLAIYCKPTNVCQECEATF